MIDEAVLTREDYSRAERFLRGERLVFGLTVEPRWIGDGTRFWYRSTTRDGKEFLVVDAENGTCEPAFDHARLAAALTKATGQSYLAVQLPLEDVEFDAEFNSVTFAVSGAHWRCDLDGYICETVETSKATPGVVKSPCGPTELFVRDANLWMRRDGHEIALTDDGEPQWQYAAPIQSPLVEAGLATPGEESNPVILWSPDGNSFLTERIDQRGADHFNLVQSVPLDGSLRPKAYEYVYPLPGDEHVPTARFMVFRLGEDGVSRTDLDMEPVSVLYYGSGFELRSGWARWTEDGAHVYILTRERGYQGYALVRADVHTGSAKTLIAEHAGTGIDPHLTYGGEPNVRILSGGEELLWFSQRDGWGHLYLYDGEGALKRQVTSGSWAVADIKFVDETSRTVYFTAVGKEEDVDPYYQHLYRCSLDGGEVEILTPEPAHHRVSFSPSGQYFVDTYSRVDTSPVTVLRTVDCHGDAVILQRADTTLLEEAGWTPTERFRATGRDGVTDIYGIIIRPSNFDPARKYPVIDDIYGGPQTNRAHVSFAHSAEGRSAAFWHAQGLAELGFVVVMMDGMGMPYRSKQFADVAFRNLADGGVPDHMAALRELGARYPYMDLDRVGIYGHSAGGYSSAHAILAYPEFFKVAVSSAGNHHHALDKAVWVERYMGLPVGPHYDEQANEALAANLDGKLLLIHGDMDENVHVASTMRLVDALIKANKDFDMLILPNRPHRCTDDPYFIRRRWDYFVRYLARLEPPRGYRLEEVHS